ncbi:hypothetical protein DEO72_LG11g1540 [Vigna unguiculata]|uniref:Aminotransferase-like n=1 Tax=Vigna unguiculata TaxID=3917 RepID=A0A4D6NMH6_VIGUN|nr:hypothetical protein DEO72_LG11g1540 [Vigna unguiculata]
MSSKRQRKCSPEAGNKGKKTKVVKNVDQVRIVHRCESKYIVEVNNVLKDTHRKWTQATPFRWCLEVDNALEINCPLLREVLHRWVPQGEYIRVGQHLVLVWLVNVLNLMLMTSRTVSNMPFKDLDNLDNLSDYNWVESFHSFFISALNRGCKVVREKINTRSLNLAGSVVVVQVWVARRLGLENVEGEVQFPRFLWWPSVKVRTPNIESAFEKNKIVLG